MDTTLVSALLQLHRDVPSLVLDRSRQLDDMLLRGAVSGVFTGPWIIDMARTRNVTLYARVMPSILNADVLAVTRKSQHTREAHALIRFLTSYEQARAFCERISDAGFPADLDRAERDTLFTRDTLVRQFLATARRSRPLPRSATLLKIEPFIEDMLSRALATRDSAELHALIVKTRLQVATIESR